MRVFIAVTFLLTAAWLWFAAAPSSAALEGLGATAKVPLAQIDPWSVRSEITDPPTIRWGGVEQRCSGCHSIFPPAAEAPTRLLQHEHVVLRHGTVEACGECHLGELRDRLVVKDGEAVGFDASGTHCTSCHEPIAAEWEAGIHGRAVDARDPRGEGRERLACLQCHDPHAPAYEAVAPLPGPRGGGAR